MVLCLLIVQVIKKVTDLRILINLNLNVIVWGRATAPIWNIGDTMAQYWYKKDKRVKSISEQHDDRQVIQQVADLKAKGYVQVLDRRNPEDSIVEHPKPKPKAKPKAKPKSKAKAKKK